MWKGKEPSQKRNNLAAGGSKGCPLRRLRVTDGDEEPPAAALSSSDDECPLRPSIQSLWSSRSHELLGRTVRRRFLGHKLHEDGLTADQYSTLDSETPTQAAEKIGCSVTELLALNNDREQTTTHLAHQLLHI